MRDIRGAAQVATIVIWAYLGLELLYSALHLYEFGSGSYAFYDDFRPSDMAGLLFMVVAVLCIVLVARWIYLAHWNAHQLSGDLAISPGWAVGWYFIPIANLFKPYQAMKECWMASHNRWDAYSEPPPPLLGWWWGLWIVTNILSNVSTRMVMSGDGERMWGAIVTLDLIVAALSIPLCMSLVSIIRRVTDAQRSTHQGEVFA